MTKYYIHISDEKPTNLAKGISFELDSENNQENKMYVVSEHEYNDMVTEWDSVKNEYMRNLTDNVISILSDTNVQHSEDAYKIAQIGDSTKYYTYPSLKSKLDDLTNNKADKSKVSQLETDLGSRATNTKVNAVDKKIDDLTANLTWKKIPNFEKSETYNGITGTIKGYYNDYFVTIIIHKFPKNFTTTYQYSDIVTNFLVPEPYRPITLVQESGGDYYGTQCAVSDWGAIRVRHTKLETARISAYITYPRIVEEEEEDET